MDVEQWIFWRSCDHSDEFHWPNPPKMLEGSGQTDGIFGKW